MNAEAIEALLRQAVNPESQCDHVFRRSKTTGGPVLWSESQIPSTSPRTAL